MSQETPAHDLDYVKHHVHKLKDKARPELKKKGWSCYGYAAKPALWNGHDVQDHPSIERVDYQTTSPAEFIEKYEAPSRPCVIVNAMNDWPAMKAWTIQRLSERFARQKFKCGEDDDGYPVKIRMEYFKLYQEYNEDDSPLYIFDGTFGDKDGKKTLLDDYKIPKYFTDDLFQYGGEERRPPYRWIVIGPQRSGTGIHIDPLGTSAWNALISGEKRWCLFPPDTPKECLKVPRSKGDSEAVSWFSNMIPVVRRPDWAFNKPIEFIQRPGEIVFVPGGWHHVVINITDTVAVTQNFVSDTNFAIVYRRTVRGRPKLSRKWLAALRSVRPELAAQADALDLDRDDGLPMSSSSDDSSSSSSSSDDEVVVESATGKKKKKTKSRSQKRTKLCQCEECLRKCKICAEYLKRGEKPPAH